MTRCKGWILDVFIRWLQAHKIEFRLEHNRHELVSLPTVACSGHFHQRDWFATPPKLVGLIQVGDIR